MRDPHAILGTWELIRPSAPASIGAHGLDALSLGGITWIVAPVHVTGVSRFFSVGGSFAEVYTLAGTTETVERFGTFAVQSDRTLLVQLDSVVLSTNGVNVSVAPIIGPMRLDLCYLDDDFCLMGRPRERAETVQAWVNVDPSPGVW